LNRAVVATGRTVVAGRRHRRRGVDRRLTGPHLHFEVHDGEWNQIDPAPWMRARGVDLGC
jgi:murein DD-endopeptidase MepM/ murein hydrolase activator NlpD